LSSFTGLAFLRLFFTTTLSVVRRFFEWMLFFALGFTLDLFFWSSLRLFNLRMFRILRFSRFGAGRTGFLAGFLFLFVIQEAS
jgi:hypothetical protein